GLPEGLGQGDRFRVAPRALKITRSGGHPSHHFGSKCKDAVRPQGDQNFNDRPMDGATGNPFRRPLMYWPVRATVRSVDSTLYSFLRLSTLSTSPESVKRPHRKRKTLRRRRSSRSYGGRRTWFRSDPSRSVARS